MIGAIPNEIVAAIYIDSLHRADRLAQAQRDATITLPRHQYRELPPAHVADAAMKKGER